MRAWDNLKAFFGTERQSLSYQDVFGRGDEWNPVRTWAEVPVTEGSAQRLSVVWRCIDLISGTIAGLPSEVVRQQGDIRVPVDRPPGWIEYPNPDNDWMQYLERALECLLSNGNAFTLVTSRDPQGFPREIWNLDPNDIVVRRRGGAKEYVWGGSTVLSDFDPLTHAGDVLHTHLRTGNGLRGMSPIEAARQAIGLGLVAEKFGSRFFGSGQQMSWVIQLPAPEQGGAARSKEYIELMRDTWQEAHAGSDRAHRPAILTGGATWHGITIPPEDAQFLQTRAFQVEEIGTRFYGVPPNFIGLTEKQSSWGPGLEQQSIALLRFTLLTHIRRLEWAHTKLVPRGQFHRINTRGLLRGDTETESRVMSQKLEHGVINRDEWRAFEDLPPVPGGTRYMIPGNMKLLGSDGLPDEPAEPEEVAPSPNGNGRVTTVGG